MNPDAKPPIVPAEPEPVNLAVTYQPAPSYRELAEMVKAVIASQEATLRDLREARRLLSGTTRQPRRQWVENLEAYITVED